MDYSTLTKCTLFKGIDRKDIEIGLKSISHKIHHYDKNEIIFHLLEPADLLGIILKGRAESQKPFPNGNQFSVTIKKPGDIIGAAAVFSTSHKYPCDIVATESIDVLIFNKDDFLRLIQSNLIILENFMTDMASTTYMLQQKLTLLSYSAIIKKIAYYLILQKKRLNSDIIPIPGSVTKWSLLMNVSRPSLHRELKRLEEQGVILYKKNSIEILDPDALEDILEK